jgi:penicillin-binding protein 1C
LRMETSLSKDSILALYASQAPFGGNTVGLEAAAWRYFSHPPH